MGMGDAYSRQRIFYSDISGNRNVLTSDSGTSNLVTNSKTPEQIFLQRLHIEITATAAQTWSFQDSNSISLVPSVSTASIAHFDFDFGPIGIALTAAKNLQLVISASGAGGWIAWEGYVKRTIVAAP